MLSGTASLIVVTSVLLLAPIASGSVPSTTLHAPYKGGIVPSASLQTYTCAKATQVKPWHFNFHSGVGGAFTTVSAKACPMNQYRLGDYGRGTATTGAIISIAVKVPVGIHNVTASVRLNWSATILERNGTTNGVCPSFPTNSTSGSYYNGSSWSYYPSLSGPIAYTNQTYFYYYHSYGAQSNGCQSWSAINAYMQEVMVDTSGTASASMNPGIVNFADAYVSTQNSTDWICHNYTLWSYGSWSNSTVTCNNYNSTINSASYDYLTRTTGTNSTLTFSGRSTLTMWALANGTASRNWVFWLLPYVFLDCYTVGWNRGSAVGSFNMATLGNGLTVQSITVT
ncbi:MAG: hypothetical protein ACHQ2Y_01890 [Candidatus Lutacidiplasmatales archaeon]